MIAARSDPFHFLVRALLICAGTLLLWVAPVSVAGLVLMFLGLVCAVAALTLEKTQQF